MRYWETFQSTGRHGETFQCTGRHGETFQCTGPCSCIQMSLIARTSKFCSALQKAERYLRPHVYNSLQIPSHFSPCFHKHRTTLAFLFCCVVVVCLTDPENHILKCLCTPLCHSIRLCPSTPQCQHIVAMYTAMSQ